MYFDKKCKWHKSCGADFCHGEGVCPEFEYKQANPIPKPTHKKRKLEPVVKLKLQSDKECYNCGTTISLERHHCIHGNGNRQKAERYNLVVWLCSKCHRGKEGVHFNPELDLEIKRLAQMEFEKVYSHDKWMNVFKKSYL